MKVELRFEADAWPLGHDLSISIDGPPEKVDDVVEAIRAKAKNWEYWKEK